MERPRNPEELGRGQLYFLTHPGSELFSGYGLTTQEGRKDRLVGLLMVDRPTPANPAWLNAIEELYGECLLTPMTVDGARGLLTHMHIDARSLPLIQRPASFPSRNGRLEQALRPLLEERPAPTLKLSWDARRGMWKSEFWIGLPPVLQDVFAEVGAGCLAVERANEVIFVAHADDHDISRFRHAPVLWRWQLVKMPTAPLIRFHATIFDSLWSGSTFSLEHFLNVDDALQARCLSRLVKQPELTFEFYGEEFEYRFAQGVPNPESMQRQLDSIVREAIDYYGDIPASLRNFDQAKGEFLRAFP